MKRKIFSKLLMGAFLIASVSMFVSCKDYDDDIQKNAQDIAALKAALGTDINAAKSELTAQLTTAKAELQTAIDKAVAAKANQSDLDKTNAELEALKKDVTELAGKVTALETQLAALEGIQGDLAKLSDALAGKADAEKLSELEGKLAAITGDLDKYITKEDAEAIAAAAVATLDNQLKTFEAYEARIKDLEGKVLDKTDVEALTNDVADLKDKLSKIDIDAAIAKLDEKVDEAITDLKNQFQPMSDSITKFNDELNVIKNFVNKRLTSLVLRPNFYWDGIEGIEAPYIKATPVFKPVGKYEFNYVVTNNGSPAQYTYSNGTKGDYIIHVKVDTVMAVELAAAQAGKSFVVLEGRDGNEGVGLQGNAVVPAHGYWPLRGYNGRESMNNSTIANYVKNWNNAAKPKTVNIYQPLLASYHINPSTANIDGSAISFYENITGVYSRQEVTGSIKPTAIASKFVAGADTLKGANKWNTNILDNGILTVPFKVEYDKVFDYFYEWAYRNDTYSSWNSTFTTEPDWDDEYLVYLSFNDQKNTPDAITDENGNFLYYDWWSVIRYYSERANNYGTSSDYYKNGNSSEYRSYEAKLPFIAAQLSASDTTVTSDYAVVVPAVYSIVALADNGKALDQNGKENFVAEAESMFSKEHYYGSNSYSSYPGRIRGNHLYESVGYTNENPATTPNTEYDWRSYGAIPMPATHTVEWNGTIDLLPTIETHYNYLTYTKYGQSMNDGVMSEDMLNSLGLHYEFFIVDYTKGNEKTSESMHIRQIGDAKSGLFTPVAVEVDAEGNGHRYADNRQNRNTIDREPLIRVHLVDASGNIVRFGYIKLRITDTAQQYDDKDVTVNLPDMYMNCGAQGRMTWAQVEDLILDELGTDGFTKQEFEAAYYLDVEGGYQVMPIQRGQNYSYNGFTWWAPSGKLYTDAAANSWWAKRYVKNAEGKYVPAQIDPDKEAFTETTALGKFDKFTESNNWFGRVWYTPHDNATNPDAYDSQTNVLVWDLNEDTNASNLWTKKRIETFRDVAGVSYDSEGKSTKAVSTVVRFVNKVNKSSIWVTLNIPAGKLHFEYGEIGNKNWSHWFEFNSVKTGSASSTSPYWTEFDTRINPFKPSNVNYRDLEVNDFNNQLTDHWMKPSEMVTLKGGADNFDKFEGKAKWASSVDFTLTWPVKDTNSTFSATESEIEIDGVKTKIHWWKIKGASSDKKGYTEWTLVIGKHGAKWSKGNTAIFAVQKDGVAYASEEVAYLDEGTEASTTNEKLIFHGIETAADLYPAATSLVNYMGAYDEKANPRFSTTSNELTNLTKAYFLEDNRDRAFTAYVKINIAHACYDPLIAKQYFNVRFHRPINVVAKVYDWNDRNLADNTIEIKDLIEIVDWNRFPVVPFGTNTKIAARNTEFGMDFPAYATVFGGAGKVKQQEFGIPYEFYGIQELAIRYDQIRSDMPKPTGIRSAIYTTANDIITNTVQVKDIPALYSDREAPAGYKTVTLLNADGTIAGFNKNDYNLSNYNAAAPGNTSFGKIYFNNDGSDTQLFHIYLPIAVKYNWGNIAYDKKLGVPKKLDQDYTQVVWAVITVNGTH
jgi:polyhydroxyalkanoate synthesis regulator phasin